MTHTTRFWFLAEIYFILTIFIVLLTAKTVNIKLYNTILTGYRSYCRDRRVVHEKTE